MAKRAGSAGMTLERVAVERLIPDPQNARLHPERNLAAIEASLRRFGQQKPLVADADGVVLAGNGTLEAAKRLGWTHVDVHRTALRGADARAFALADNRSAELAEWDYRQLGDSLREVREAGVDLSDLGYDTHDVDTILGVTFDPEKVGESDGTPRIAIVFSPEDRAVVEDAVKAWREREDNAKAHASTAVTAICRAFLESTLT